MAMSVRNTTSSKSRIDRAPPAEERTDVSVYIYITVLTFAFLVFKEHERLYLPTEWSKRPEVKDHFYKFCVEGTRKVGKRRSSVDRAIARIIARYVKELSFEFYDYYSKIEKNCEIRDLT